MGTRDLEANFLGILDHLGNVLTKLIEKDRSDGFLLETDLHTIAEGLFLSAFTHWEQFTRNLLIDDMTSSPTSAIHRAVKEFHDPEAPRRFAIQLLQHPDHPRKFVEWSNYADIESRANEFLGAGNRFASTPLPRKGDLDKLKRVRNAIAHRSDKAWTSFLDLCEEPPFSIPTAQIASITPGRFLVTYQLNGQPILRDTFTLLGAAAHHLVP